MSDIKIYHNPKCSKSRATLALLEENEAKPEIIYYLETPPSIEDLKSILQKPLTAPMGNPSDFLVRGGSAWYARKIKAEPSIKCK